MGNANPLLIYALYLGSSLSFVVVNIALAAFATGRGVKPLALAVLAAAVAYALFVWAMRTANQTLGVAAALSMSLSLLLTGAWSAIHHAPSASQLAAYGLLIGVIALLHAGVPSSP
ncbi:MAG: hypothetical protein AAF515_16775 [Pseudomonadota bacterium]